MMYVHTCTQGYMLLQPLEKSELTALYPGRKYLFDLGTGRSYPLELPHGRTCIVLLCMQLRTCTTSVEKGQHQD